MSADNAKVKVCIRMRPVGEEAEINHFGFVDHIPNIVSIVDPVHPDRPEREFMFDRIFRPATSQEDIYADVCKDLVEHVMRGFNSCCFAYGQTGSGKTYR